MKINIRGKGVTLKPGVKAQAERDIVYALDRFSAAITEVALVVEDVNGPKGGEDKHCTLTLDVAGAGRLCLEGTGAETGVLIHSTAHRAAEAVRRKLDKLHDLALHGNLQADPREYKGGGI